MKSRGDRASFSIHDETALLVGLSKPGLAGVEPRELGGAKNIGPPWGPISNSRSAGKRRPRISSCWFCWLVRVFQNVSSTGPN